MGVMTQKVILLTRAGLTQNSVLRKSWLSVLLITPLVFAQTPQDTQQSIHRLDNQIHSLRQHMSLSLTQKTQLKQAISHLDALIKNNLSKLQQVQLDITQKQKNIRDLEKTTASLNTTLKEQQKQLSEHLRARYRTKDNPPLIWLIFNPHSDRTQQILTYYQYLIRAQQDNLKKLQETRQALQKQQQQLQDALTTLTALHDQYQQQQKQWLDHQNHRKELLAKLNQTIQTEANALTIFEKDREKLSKILRTLSQQSVTRTRQSMTRMKTQLPLPVAIDSDEDIQKANQGIILCSAEASPVHAVYPGKVVFRDWLNGYGYLMILDHGWGLMTLYGNNEGFTKQKGDIVLQGEQIARVGHSGHIQRSGLYFEVRRYGKAVPPLEWLKTKR